MHLLLRGSYSISRAMERLAPEDFARYADAVSALFALAKEEDGPDRLSGSEGRRLVTAWLDRLPDEQAERLRALAVSDERDSDSERALAQLEGRLRLESLDRRLRALPQRIQEAEARGDRASVEELYREQQALSVERRRLMREIGWGAIASQGGGTHHA